MTKYCVTAVNRNNKNDDRVSELKVWEEYFNEQEKRFEWRSLGKKTANFIAIRLANGDKVVSGKETKKDGKVVGLNLEDEIEFVLRIANNNDKVKLTDMPSF